MQSFAEPLTLFMRNSYTVLVIGGGPAGSAAAHTLASNGTDVCLVDKFDFPRQKLCGGLLTQRARKNYADIFGTGWEQMYEYRCNGAKFFDGDRLVNAIDRYGELYVCDRYRFDNRLIEKASAQGADLLLGDKVTVVDPRNHRCRLKSGKEIGYRYLIGADGVNSVVTSTLYKNRTSRNGKAFALEVTLPAAAFSREIVEPEIYFDTLDWGYGWIFPRKDEIVIGIGGLFSRNRDFRAIFNSFFRERFHKEYTGAVKGHFVPFGDYSKGMGRDGVLLAGDAAGLVDPITGEGIAYAMQSGAYAAQSVLEALNGKTRNVNTEYRKRCAVITDELSYAARIRYFLFSAWSRELFVNALARSASIPRRYMDLMSGDITYRELLGNSGRKLLRMTARKITGR
jgi:geranylgeranyl reductase family protein